MSSWYKLYSPKLNQDRIEKLFKKFNIEKYNFANNGYGDYDVYIRIGLYSYKLEINPKKEELIIYKNITYKNYNSSKEIYLHSKTIHNDVWFNALKFITK